MRSVLRWLARHRLLTLLGLGAAGAAVRLGLRPAASTPSPRPPSPRAPLPERPERPAAPVPVEPVPADRRVPEPPLAGAASPEPGEHPGSVRSLEDGSAPSPEYTVKGNAASMRCHGPESPYYARTKAELWFRSEADAEAAGFTPWRPQRRRS